MRPYKYWFRWLHSMFNDASGMYVTCLFFPFTFPQLNDYEFYWWAEVIMKSLLIIILVNLAWILAHILFSLRWCCRCCFMRQKMQKVIPEDLHFPEEKEEPDPEKPPAPQIVIAPPKDLVIPSAAVDA